LEKLGKHVEVKNNTFHDIMSSWLEKEPSSTDEPKTKVSSAVNSIRQVLGGICSANENLFDTNDQNLVRIEMLEKKLLMLEERKQDRNDSKEDKFEIKKELRGEINGSIDRIDEKMSVIEKEVESKMNQTLQRIGELQKETIWKIKDCEENIKIRPTDSFVQTCINQLQETLET
jgi:hypothetical protein